MRKGFKEIIAYIKYINMNNYQEAKIYKVVNRLNSEIYVGSSTVDLEQRMIKHRCEAKQRPYLSKFYTYMNELGIDNFEIELIEEFPCECQEELRRREGEIIQEIGTLNQRVAGRTTAEYGKEYSKNNRDKINKRRNERRQENPEKTKEERKRDGALYRQRHPEQIKEWHTTKIDCDCGGKYTLSHKAEHMNSKKHLQFLGTYNEEEYKQSKRYTQMKNQYDKYKDTLDEDKMKEHKKKSYEKHKDKYSETSKERMICQCGADICKGAYLRHCKSNFHQNFLNNNITNVSSQEEKQQQEKQ